MNHIEIDYLEKEKIHIDWFKDGIQNGYYLS